MNAPAAGVTRRDVVIDQHGTQLAGWLFEPTGPPAPWPVVVLAHGFGGVRGSRLDAFAERFAAAGLAALVFDYRGFGASGGRPRHLVDPVRQQDDYRAALRFAAQHPDLDEHRIALWGTSYSGGHVLQLAAERPDVRAVVAMVPHVDGLATLNALPPLLAARVLALGVADEVAGRRGRPRREIAAVGRPGEVAAMTAPGALDGVRRLAAPDGSHPERLLAASVLPVGRYRPGVHARRITAPLLVQLADGDTVTPVRPARRAARRAARGELRTYPGGHFDVYTAPLFDAVVDDQVEFLRHHLSGAPRPPVAVVTGAGSGLGRELALGLARRGHAVACLDIDLPAARRTADAVAALGLPAAAHRCDVADERDVADAATRVEHDLGPVDVWVNNAGVGVAGDVGELPPDDWRHVTDIDLLGVAWGCHVAVPRMRRRDRGRILNISSLAAYGTPAGQAPYNAAKAGVLALSESLMAELRGTGVHVAVACPTYFVTPIADAMRVVDEDERLRQQLLLADAASGTARTVADAVLDGLAAGGTHLFPQPFAKVVSRLKRLAPGPMIAVSVVLTRRRGEKLLARAKGARTVPRRP